MAPQGPHLLRLLRSWHQGDLGYVDEYRHFATDSGYFEEKRQRQTKWWMYESINEALKNSFYQSEAIRSLRPEVESDILSDRLSSFVGAQRLLDAYFKSLK